MCECKTEQTRLFILRRNVSEIVDVFMLYIVFWDVAGNLDKGGYFGVFNT